MPVITIVCNKDISADLSQELIASVTKTLASACRVPNKAIHTLVQAGCTLAYGEDLNTPAAFVTIKSSAQQIPSDSRKSIVVGLVPALQLAIPGLDPQRITTMFEELPVECIAVGTNIATFSKSGGGSAVVSPTAAGAAKPHPL